MSQPLALHLLIALLAFLFAYASAWLAGRISQPEQPSHAHWVPVAAGLVPTFLMIAAFTDWGSVAALLAGALLVLFGFGLLLHTFKVSGRWILLALLACCIVLATKGVTLTAVKLPLSSRFVTLGGAGVLASAAWLFLVSGLTTFAAGAPWTANGITLITSLAFLCISVLQPQPGSPSVSYFCVALAATTLGLGVASAPRLALTLAPSARAALGLSLGVVSLVGALKTSAFLILLIPLLLFGVPIADAVFPLLAPAATRESDARRRPRLYELLVARGMTPSQILVLFMLAATYLALLAILLVALIRVHFLLKALLIVLFLPAGFVFLYGLYKVVAPVVRRADQEAAPQIELFHVPVACLTEEEVLQRCRDFITSGEPHHVVTCDAISLVRAQTDPDLLGILREADLVTADGAGVVWAARMLGLEVPARLSGVDLVGSVCGLAAKEGFRVYLLGAQPGVADEAAQRLQARHPTLQVAGCHHGYFTPDEEPALLQDIRFREPQVLFVGLGAPKQDTWIHAHLADLGIPLAMGVGGSFDVISGRVPRSPQWMQRWGLEWLYRALREPKRLPRLLALPRLVVLTLTAWVRGRGKERPGGDAGRSG